MADFLCPSKPYQIHKNIFLKIRSPVVLPSVYEDTAKELTNYANHDAVNIACLTQKTKTIKSVGG